MSVAVARLAGKDISLDEVWAFWRLQGLHRPGLRAFAECGAIRALARQDGVTVSEDELLARLTEIRRAQGLLKAADVLEFLEAVGATQEAWELDAETRLLAETLQARIDDDAVRELYHTHRGDYEAIKLYEIQLESDEVGQEILAQVKEGASFQELAREHSTDPAGRDTGGFVGWVTQAELGERNMTVAEFQVRPGTPIGPRSGRLWLVAARRDELTASVQLRVRERILAERVAAYLQAQDWTIL